MSKKYELNAEEQAIEDQFESLKSVQNKQALIDDLTKAAKQHVQNKKPITIRLSVQDLEAIKIKASKCGLPYQTYLNMLIHKDATSL
ncbi:MAG: CopG family antitoxin [Gammaproteobacteria bacterium]